MALSPVPVTATNMATWVRSAAIVINYLQSNLAVLARRSVKPVTADYTFAANDYLVTVDATAAPVTITLPALSIGKQIAVKRIDASANAVTVSGPIEGGASATLTGQWSGLNLIGANSVWLRA